MRKFFLLFICLLLARLAIAQGTISTAHEGFDIFREGISHGKTDTITYNSKTVGNERNALVYTPPRYTKNKEYPVLYLLHGIGGDEYAWYENGQVQAILDNLYAEEKLEPMIVVMPNGRAMKDDRAVGNIFDSTKVEASITRKNSRIWAFSARDGSYLNTRKLLVPNMHSWRKIMIK